ncbi:diguanylate cyclase domain-containing protein [Methylobacterium sp. NEAU K]|uniref:diguanylate cyclase domain-containing protein n=1 Tax=Methylobacterium sp. NEAU K TaxID=3064946 RepID=UPI0027358F00|nr:diguanylate cyclase [Methylobacterium sp. NEAU K]MDP4003720.1 diguanylate cyclase [Methylobacterium sp. NEAU K]
MTLRKQFPMERPAAERGMVPAGRLKGVAMMARTGRVSAKRERRERGPIFGPQPYGLRRDRRLGARIIRALDSLPHGFCLFDATDRLLFVNDGYRRIFDQPATQVRPGMHARTLIAANIARGLKAGQDPSEIWAERRHILARRETGSLLQTLVDGRQIAITLQPQAAGGWVALYEDVTERCRAESLLRYMAHHDPLTGLPNRYLFEARLDRATAGPDSGGCALLCIDLDDFKPVNDRYGHAVGDALLRQMAERLRESLGERDTAARLGGDEFAVLLGDATAETALAFAQRVHGRLAEPYAVAAGQPVRVGAAIGVACAPQHASRALALVERADAAMYEAKRLGHPCLWSDALGFGPAPAGS